MELVLGDHDGNDAVLARDARAELCTFERKRAASTAGEANHCFDVLALALGGTTVLLTDLWYLCSPLSVWTIGAIKLLFTLVFILLNSSHSCIHNTISCSQLIDLHTVVLSVPVRKLLI